MNFKATILSVCLAMLVGAPAFAKANKEQLLHELRSFPLHSADLHRTSTILRSLIAFTPTNAFRYYRVALSKAPYSVDAVDFLTKKAGRSLKNSDLTENQKIGLIRQIVKYSDSAKPGYIY